MTDYCAFCTDQGASRKLDKNPDDVADFVEHLSFLAKMITDMPGLEKEFDIVTKLYTICKEFNVETEPEQLALYQTLAPSFQHLKVCARLYRQVQVYVVTTSLVSTSKWRTLPVHIDYKHDIQDRVFFYMYYFYRTLNISLYNVATENICLLNMSLPTELSIVL